MSARSRTALALARPYIRRRLRRAFDGLFVEGLESARELAARQPLLVAANHVCWWDALTILAIDEPLGIESHCLMDAENLRRMPFFGWVGAVSLDRRSPRSSVRDLAAATRALDRAGRSLWIFPQGRQRPAHIRPLGLEPGVAWLANRTGAAVLPLSLNYLFREAPQPTIVASFGRPLAPPGRSSREKATWLLDLERALIQGLERGDRFAMSGTGSFEALVAPRRSTGVPAAGRFLALAMGGRPRHV